MATRRSIQIGAFNGLNKLAAGCSAVDEQAALGNNLLAGFQITLDFDKVAIGEAGLDPAEFDRLVLVRDPDPDLTTLVDQGLLRHADRRVIAGGIDRDIREHLRLQETILVIYRGADQKPARRGIDRRGNIVDAGLQLAARQRQHIKSDFLPHRYIRRIGLADEGREPDRGEIADHKYRIPGAAV